MVVGVDVGMWLWVWGSEWMGINVVYARGRLWLCVCGPRGWVCGCGCGCGCGCVVVGVCVDVCVCVRAWVGLCVCVCVYVCGVAGVGEWVGVNVVMRVVDFTEVGKSVPRRKRVFGCVK